MAHMKIEIRPELASKIAAADLAACDARMALDRLRDQAMMEGGALAVGTRVVVVRDGRRLRGIIHGRRLDGWNVRYVIGKSECGINRTNTGIVMRDGDTLEVVQD
jgi:hypothetical protein